VVIVSTMSTKWLWILIFFLFLVNSNELFNELFGILHYRIANIDFKATIFISIYKYKYRKITRRHCKKCVFFGVFVMNFVVKFSFDRKFWIVNSRISVREWNKWNENIEEGANNQITIVHLCIMRLIFTFLYGFIIFKLFLFCIKLF